MILASGITNYVSFTEIFGEGTIIFAGLLMIWLLAEKLEVQLAPLAIIPALFWVGLSSPRLLSEISRFDYPEGFRLAMILLPGLALLGIYSLWRKKEIHRRFFA